MKDYEYLSHTADVKFRAYGKTLEEAMKITPQSVADELEGLPKNKFHCSNLGAQALHKAIDDYMGKKMGVKKETPSAEKQFEELIHAHCPYCESELEDKESPFCQACHAELPHCPGCHEPVPKDANVCPHCGANI